MTKAARLTAINDNRTRRLFSVHGLPNADCLPRDSRTEKGYRNAILLSAEFETGRGADLSPDQDPQGAFLKSELHRAIAHEFAVEFNWNCLIAFHAKPTRLKILNLRHSDFRAEYDVLEIFDDFQVAESLEHNDVQ